MFTPTTTAPVSVRATYLFAALAVWPSILNAAAVLPVVVNQRYDVAITTASLTDFDRLDPFASDVRARSIMVSSFNPILSCKDKRPEPYMPRKTAIFQDEKFGAYGLPNGTFQSLQVETCKGSGNKSRCSPETLPLVLFSGALGTSRLIYTNLLQNIAAAGYLVVSVDHPYDADIVEFLDGTVVTGVNLDSDADIERTLITRADDMAFVRRQLANASVANTLFPGKLQGKPIAKTAAIGHSLGGAAAATMILRNPDIDAGLNIDGTMFGDVVTTGFDRPFMLIGHDNKTQETDPSWKSIWPQLRGWKSEIEVLGAAHYSFSDLPLITSVIGLQDKLPSQVEQVLGTVEGHRMTNLTAVYVTAFLDMVFKSGSEDKLVNGNVDFPEVKKVA